MRLAVLKSQSIIARITDRHITSAPAIRTLQKAFAEQPVRKGELLLQYILKNTLPLFSVILTVYNP